MDTDADLDTLIQRKDHVNVLRYLRVHQLRRPELVLKHGRQMLGDDLQRATRTQPHMAALEQMIVASLDHQDHTTAQLALDRLVQLGVERSSARFRRLLAQCLDASGDTAGAQAVYKDLLKENPCSMTALQGEYCLYKAQVGHEVQAAEALDRILTQDPSHVPAWYEMAHLRMNLGDYKAATYCLQQVLLHAPTDPHLHVLLAECLVTSADGDAATLPLARQHYCQALELDPQHRRAQWGLLVTAQRSATVNNGDAHDADVAKALQAHATQALKASYQGTTMAGVVAGMVSGPE